MRRVVLVMFAAAVVSSQQKALYQDPSAPLDQRVDDLISRMTLEEKAGQMMNDAPAIDRLGVPAYNWWNECLHGVGRAGRATVFPQAIGLAATWDTDQIYKVAMAISDEARAKHHEALRRGQHNIYQGLTFWTPNINLFRDPRWGRGMETYGEDPYLTGALAVQFIRGIQGDDPKYLKAVATAKHYAVHSGPESIRHTFDAVISEQDLRQTYLPQFEMAVKQGHAASVMCAYNRVDGSPACASPMLLEDILRKEWGFNGYVVSDCGAVSDIYLRHKTAPNANEGVAQAVKAGTDLSCGTEYTHLVPAVQAGLLAEADLNRSLHRLFRARFQLGMFDPPAMVKYAQIPYSVNDSAAHRALALETARKSMVLLKNDNHALPLSKSLKTIAVIGPNADDPETLLGNYNGEPSAPVTPLAGLRHKLGSNRVIYARGSALAENAPTLEAIPATALFTTDGADRRPGLKAEYFDSADFDGQRHRPRQPAPPASGQAAGQPAEMKPIATRVDAQVDFNWWDQAPLPGLKELDYGVRWSGYLTPKVSGKYQIGAFGMSAFEVYINGQRIARQNNIHESTHQYGAVDLEAGKLYAVRFDFHHFIGNAKIRLEWALPPTDGTAEAVEAARRADATVLVLGLSPRLEGEEMRVPVEGFAGGDRVSLDLPRAQEELMEKVVAVGKPTVVVLLNGSALAVKWARDHVPAILEAWYPGQAGGDAIADVLFGDYNPGGRLPVTFYKSADQLPPFTDYSMKGRTYRFFEGEPLFRFGHGLSYTTFAYHSPRLAPDKLTVEIENTGALAGDEVVQVYAKGSLVGFRRVLLKAHEKRPVEVALPSSPTSVTVAGRTVSR